MPKYISGCLASLSAMVQLEVAHVNVLSKVDLLPDRRELNKYLDPDVRLLLADLNRDMPPQFGKLNTAIAGLVRSILRDLLP